jgi:hypothetical protein
MACIVVLEAVSSVCCRRAHLPSTEMSIAISSEYMPYSVFHAVGTKTA